MSKKSSVITLLLLAAGMAGLGGLGGIVYQHQRDAARYKAIEARRRAWDMKIARMEDELAIAMLPWQQERARLRSSEEVFAKWERERGQQERVRSQQETVRLMREQLDAMREIERELQEIRSDAERERREQQLRRIGFDLP